MLKFTQFIDDKLTEGTAKLNQVATQVAPPDPANPGGAPAPVVKKKQAPAPAPAAPAAPVEKTDMENLIATFISKYKPSGNTTQQQSDPLTLKIQNFRAGQAIDIKLKPNIDIKAQVVAAGKKKFCKLLKSNIEEISLLLNQEKQQPVDSGIKDVAGNPMKSQPTQPKPIFFQSFKDKNLTWFYFYDNMDFVTNSKQKPVFSKTYTVLSVE